MPIEIPEIRQEGKGVDRAWQWKFGDGKWRDMNQDLTRGTVKTYRERTEPYSAWEAFWRNAIPGQQQTQIEEEVPGDIVDFDALVEKTDILPDYLSGNISTAYMLMLSGLWAEITGYSEKDGNYQPDASWNMESTGGITDVSEDLIDSTLQDILPDLASTYGWDAVAEARGYTIDWTQDTNGIAPEALFLNQTQDDAIKGTRYDKFDTRADLKREGPRPPPADAKDKIDVGGGETAGGRKILATVTSQDQAAMMASQIEGAMVEPVAGGFAVTVAPGQGGWGTEDAGKKWLEETGIGASGNFEMAPGKEGQWYIREKATDTQQTFTTKDEAEAWLRRTGNVQDDEGNLLIPEGFEAVPGPGGNWVVREKAVEPREPRYGTPDQAGDMFQPTITEDPTGRKFGTTAGGDIKDFGYGMAGDITQEELAGYQVPSRSLPDIVAKAIEQGKWELARAVQAVIDSPTERDLLDYAAQYAEAPADLAVLSAIARGEQMVQPGGDIYGGGAPISSVPEGMGTGQGQATRIGPPGEVYTSAYKSFIDSMNQGYVPDEVELRELFDPKNDPAYIATQELANKYETEIGTLRDQINEANKTASERIENNQTQTMNMMTGMFENSLSSFKELMETTTGMQSDEITRLTEQLESMRMGTEDTGSSSSSTAGNLGGENPVITDESDTGKWFWDTSGDGKWVQYNGEGKFDTLGGRYLPEPEGQDFASTGQPHPDHVGSGGSKPTSFITGDDKTGDDELTDTGIPTDIADRFGTYQDVMRAGEAASPALQEQFADIVTNVPGETATESQFAYQTGGKDWESGDDSWQSSYFGDQAKTEQESLAIRPDQWEFEGAEGGVVQGPTMALLGEKEPEFIVPFSKVDEFRRGKLPIGNPRQTRRGSTVANFTDSMPRFANGGLVTGPRFGGVTASELQQYGDTGAYVTPGTRTELDLGAEGKYGADGISRAPRIKSDDFQSLLTQYPGSSDSGESNIPEYELRHRLGASEFAGTNPAQHPIGIQQLMAGRPMGRPSSLMTQANMPTPSGQALRNMLPSELAYYKKMGRMAGIPQEELDQEMRSAMPGGTRRTPLSMRARRVRQA